MPDGGKKKKTFSMLELPNACLQTVYLGASYIECPKPVIVSAEPRSTAHELQRFPLGCLPVIHHHPLGIGILDGLLHKRWMRWIVSLSVCSISQKTYCRISMEDIERTQRLINRIADEMEWPIEVRAFAIHNLLAYVVAYRSELSLKKTQPFKLPVYEGPSLVLKNCVYEGSVNLFGGVLGRVFVPCDGKGSPTYLFHGTPCWACASGCGVAIVDDFNPFGVGEDIRLGVKKNLRSHLQEHEHRYGQKALAIGHSLGGLIATNLAVDLPEHILKTIAFGSPRTSYKLKERWKTLEGKCPPIHTFIGKFGGYSDPVAVLGNVWIGKVYEVATQRHSTFLGRHTIPLARLTYTIKELPIEISNEAGWHLRLWSLFQCIGSILIYFILMPCLIVKRFLIGWTYGGFWKYGLLGLWRHLIR